MGIEDNDGIILKPEMKRLYRTDRVPAVWDQRPINGDLHKVRLRSEIIQQMLPVRPPVEDSIIIRDVDR